MTVPANTAGPEPRDPWRDDAIRLAIVGSRRFKNPNAYAIALLHMTMAVSIVGPDHVLSGGAEGLDTFAAAFARSLLLPIRNFLPETGQWAGPGGFAERNDEIARTCTHLLSVRCSQSTTYGAGWTADRAAALGRQVVRVTITPRGMFPIIDGSWS